MYFIGFDIGGSSIKAALIKDKKIIKSAAENLPNNLEALFGVIAKLRSELASGPEEISGIGFSIPGPLDVKKEKILICPYIRYMDGLERELLSEQLKPHPVKIEHDVHCFLLAEKAVGLARDLNNVFYLTIGTFIGSAFMINRQIYYGAHGAASEAGFMVIGKESDQNFGSLASNKFIKSELNMEAEDARNLALVGDKKAQEVLAQLGANLGIGLANIINIFDPEAIILAGGIAESKELILPGIKEGIEKFVISPAAKETQILFSELGRFGGALGAALLFE